VRDTGGAGEVSFPDLYVEILDSTYRARTLQSGIEHRDPARVVAAILEPSQPFKQNGNNVSLGNCPDYSAHCGFPSPVFSLYTAHWRTRF
jgi:hypothetical protein